MKDKTKITLIYVCVAVIVASLLGLFTWMGQRTNKMAKNAKRERTEQLQALKLETVVPALTLYDHQLTKDLRGVNQAGEEVGLFDLKGKVVVFAQFYSRCNMCLGHNKIIMQELHDALKDNPNVHFVTVTLDPDFDSPAKLKESAEVWGADAKSWWMLNVPKDELTEYCRKQLWYLDYKKNEKATSSSDAITHDMGIAVIDTRSKLQAKVNLFELLANEKTELYKAKKSQLLEVIDIALKDAKAE